MRYTIGEVSKLTGLPTSTLRYYDKEGLFPDLDRKGGKRLFDEGCLGRLRVIECLKRSGLEIKEIKEFIDLVSQGSESYEARRDLFQRQRQKAIEEIEKLQSALALLEYKCWYYEEALARGNEDFAEDAPKHLPAEGKALFQRCFNERDPFAFASGE